MTRGDLESKSIKIKTKKLHHQVTEGDELLLSSGKKKKKKRLILHTRGKKTNQQTKENF